MTEGFEEFFAYYGWDEDFTDAADYRNRFTILMLKARSGLF